MHNTRKSVTADVYAHTRGKQKFGNWKEKFRSRAIAQTKELRSTLLTQARLTGGDGQRAMQIDTDEVRRNSRQMLADEWNLFYEEEHPDVSHDEWLLFMLEMEDIAQRLLERQYEEYNNFDKEWLEYQLSFLPEEEQGQFVGTNEATTSQDMDTDTVMT